MVAAPFLKLWPEYHELSTSALVNTSLTSVTKRVRVKGFPLLKMNSGPGFGPLFAVYAGPLYIHPCSERVCLRSFNSNLQHAAGGLQSYQLHATSWKFRWAPWSYAVSEGTVISPAPKKQSEAAAHNISVSRVASFFHAPFILLMRLGGASVRSSFP